MNGRNLELGEKGKAKNARGANHIAAHPVKGKLESDVERVIEILEQEEVRLILWVKVMIG